MELIGNFLMQPNKDFPLDCETLDGMAANTAMLEMLGNIAGDKVILYGCEPSNGGLQRNEGYVFLRTAERPGGEVLRWEGGLAGGGMCLKKEDIPIVSQGYSYPKAYTRRTLVPGIGGENYSWEDFTVLETTTELRKKIAELNKSLENIAGEPYGIVKMWAGSVVPEGYSLCDGRELECSRYPKLYAAIGTLFNNANNSNGQPLTTQSGNFRLPDLRGRFIVGQNGSDTEYQNNGMTGGEKKHLLTPEETAKIDHSHGASCSQDGYHTHGIFSEDGQDTGSGHHELGGTNGGIQTDGAGLHAHAITIASCGSANAAATHENRPPYYVLAYIIKLG